MSYKQIHETFWTDPQVKKYKPMQRYLFSYLITSPHAHYSGLYYLPLVYIENETGLKPKEIEEGIRFLTEKNHVFYDYDREVIFVKSEMPYQLDNQRDGKVILNEKHIKNIKKHFDTLHKSPLIGKFLKIYDYLEIEYTGIDRGIDTPMDRDSVPVLVPVTVIEGGVGGENGSSSKQPEKQLFKNFVLLLPDQYDKLAQKFGKEKADEYIEILDGKIGKNEKAYRKKYTSDYHVILDWQRNGWLSPQNQNQTNAGGW